MGHQFDIDAGGIYLVDAAWSAVEGSCSDTLDAGILHCYFVLFSMCCKCSSCCSYCCWMCVWAGHCAAVVDFFWVLDADTSWDKVSKYACMEHVHAFHTSDMSPCNTAAESSSGAKQALAAEFVCFGHRLSHQLWYLYVDVGFSQFDEKFYPPHFSYDSFPAGLFLFSIVFSVLCLFSTLLYWATTKLHHHK